MQFETALIYYTVFDGLFFIASEFNRQLGDTYLVFEYMEYDLGGILNSGSEFLVPEIKCLSKQLFEGWLFMAVILSSCFFYRVTQFKPLMRTNVARGLEASPILCHSQQHIQTIRKL